MKNLNLFNEDVLNLEEMNHILGGDNDTTDTTGNDGDDGDVIIWQ